MNIEVLNKKYDKFQVNWHEANYKFYSVFYPIGNGSFNFGKYIEDIK